MNIPIVIDLFILIAVVLAAKKRQNLPSYVWSKIWSLVFCLIAVDGFASSLIGYRAASVRRTALSPSDSDIAVSIPSLMIRISSAELLIGFACLIGSVIFYLRSQRQGYEDRAV